MIVALLAPQLVSAQDELLLGPPNGNIDFEGGWFMGASGASFVNLVGDGGFIEGTGRLNIGSPAVKDGNADFRSQSFSLGPAAMGEQTVTIEFYIKFTEAVKAGETILVQLRYFSNNSGSWVGEENISINDQSPGIDTQLVGEWQQFKMENIQPAPTALYADIRTSLNIWTDWSSGEAQFDVHRVLTALPELPTPVAITHFPADEVEFMSAVGKRYRIESTTDGETWTNAGGNIIGNDEMISRTFANRDGEDRSFRVLTD